jgi:hypothetical protein
LFDEEEDYLPPEVSLLLLELLSIGFLERFNVVI